VGPRGGLDWCGKSRPPPGLDPWTVQLIASRYTDYAIPAPKSIVMYLVFSCSLRDTYLSLIKRHAFVVNVF